MDLGVAGRVALVTGASHGIGQALVHRFLLEGCNVVGVSRSEVKAQIDGSGAAARHVAGDMRDPETPYRAVRSAIDEFGRLDFLVNNAAEYTRRPFSELTRADLDNLFTLKLLGYFSTVSASLPYLKQSEQAAILNIAGVAAVLPAPQAPHAGAVNASVINFSQYLAAELGPSGIRVNALSPGATRTRRFESRVAAVVADQQVDEGEAVRLLSAKAPLGRPLEPEEVASVGVFMCSPVAAGLTGAHVVLDGGRGALNSRVLPIGRRVGLANSQD